MDLGDGGLPTARFGFKFHSSFIAGQVIAIVTLRDNIFTRNENVLPAADPAGIGVGASWGHAGVHVVAIVFQGIVLWALGSLVLFAVRSLKPVRQATH